MTTDAEERLEAPHSPSALAWGLKNVGIFAAVEIVIMFLALAVHREDEDTLTELAAAAVGYSSWTWMLLLAGAIPYLVLVWLIARRRPIGRLAGVALSPVLGLPLLLTFLVGFGLEAIPWTVGGTLVAGALLRLPPHAVPPESSRHFGKRSGPRTAPEA
jgi:hypothetical protein